jgi:dienelactone hydrolase
MAAGELPCSAARVIRHVQKIAMTEINRLREELTAFLGFKSPPEIPTVRTLYQWEEERYTRSLIEYNSSDGDIIEAFLLVPKGQGPFPGVLALHQHASQWMIGKSEICGLAGDPHQAFGPALARRGICVLAPDAIGFESRMASSGAGENLAPKLDPERASAAHWLQYYNALSYRLLRGDTLMRKILADSAIGLSVMARHSQVDDRRLGVVGHSFGGSVALFLGALEPKLKYICSSGAACTYRRRMQDGTGIEFSQVIPGFAARFDVDDLLKCMVPRRVLLVSSSDDPFTRDADDIVRSALATFEALGCSDHLSHVRTKGAHALDEERHTAVVEWLTIEANRF